MLIALRRRIVEKYSKGKDYKVIAVVMACFSQDDQQMLIKRIAHQCKSYHCRAVFFSTLSNFYTGDQETIAEASVFDVIAVERFDAILLMAETFKVESPLKPLVRRANKLGVPVIAVDHYMEGCINLSFDYKEAFRKVVTHMVEFHGYRDILFMGGTPNNSFSDERLEVFKEILEKNQIPFDSKRVYYGYFWEEPTVVAVEQMLKDWPKLPEAIICANDTMALTVCDCLQKRGYRIPQDVAVSGFDGIETERFHAPRLLTSIYDINVFLETVFTLVNEKDLSCEHREIQISAHEMQIGGSCGCEGASEQNAAAEIIRVKSNMYELMDFQINLGHMVAKHGNGDGREAIFEELPYRLRFMLNHDFWCCTAYQDLLRHKISFGQFSCAPEGMGVIHIHNNGDSTSEIFTYSEHKIPDLIPDLETQLEEGNPLLVVAIPNQEDAMGYTVASFEPNSFWYKGYSTFIFHLRFLLGMTRTQRELMKLYNTDSLTGLYNRNGFYDAMDELLKESSVEKLTVISIDMYQFKQINDTYGHAEGDFALQTVGNIIQSSVVENELPVRIGGDEFLIILYQDNQEQRAKEIATEIVEKANIFNDKNEKNYKIIFSVGVCADDVKVHSLDYFLRKADERMYRHKNIQKKMKGES